MSGLFPLWLELIYPSFHPSICRTAYSDQSPPPPLEVFAYVCINVCDIQIWPKYTTRRAPWFLRDDATEWEPLPTFSVLHPIQCKCPLNPVNPLSQHGGAQQESEEARGNCDMVPPPPRWEPIQETSAHEAQQLAVTFTRQQLKYKE